MGTAGWDRLLSRQAHFKIKRVRVKMMQTDGRQLFLFGWTPIGCGVFFCFVLVFFSKFYFNWCFYNRLKEVNCSQFHHMWTSSILNFDKKTVIWISLYSWILLCIFLSKLCLLLMSFGRTHIAVNENFPDPYRTHLFCRLGK